MSSSSFGDDLQGPEFCEPFNVKVVSSGIFSGEKFTRFSLPLLMLQLGLVTILSQASYLLLRPFGQPKYVADFIGGIILGPSGFGRNKAFHDLLFPGKGLMVLDVYENVGLILFCFLIGVRTDFAVVKRAGRLSLAIGVASFLVPMLINIIMLKVFRIGTKMDNKSFSSSLYNLAQLEAMINFQAMSTILTNLKLVNSELGRVALSSSMISSLCTWISALLQITVKDASEGLALLTLARVSSRFLLVAVAIFLIRPIMFWMIKHTPEERKLRESYVCAITLWVFAAALYSEINGINPNFSCIFIGMAVPGGPPLASGLVEKLESFVSAVLLPSFAANIGRKVNIYLIRPRHFAMVEGFVILAICGKSVASMVPSMYWHMPLRDTFLVGLLLSCQGLLDIQFMNQALHAKFIDQETMTIAVIMAILHATVITPVVRRLYDPSRRYSVSHKRRTMQESKQDELRILACIHHEDNVPTIIDILEASNPTRESPIEVHVIDLEELVGRAMPLFITHRLSRNPSTKSGRTRRIIKAFRQYESRNQGLVSVQCYTSIAPYATIHDDICTLALEKSTSLVIISYKHSDSHSIRTVNMNVLEKAPCSVGILVDRESIKESKAALRSWFTFHVCVIFIGGADDREALIYGTRMAEHPSISLTVIRITCTNHETRDILEGKLDLNAFNKFKVATMGNNRVVYKEEVVAEGPGTIRVLQSLKNVDYDLMLVGRRHDNESPIMFGLAEWSEIMELGIIGDILTSSDFKIKASVLVVQQHASVLEAMLQSPIDWTPEPVQSSLTDDSSLDLERCNSSHSTQQLLAISK